MGNGLMQEFHAAPAILKGQWVRDRVHGGMTRRDLRYNLRKLPHHHGMIAIYAVGPDGLALQGFRNTLESALKHIQRLDQQWAEREARAEYDRLMMWAR